MSPRHGSHVLGDRSLWVVTLLLTVTGTVCAQPSVDVVSVRENQSGVINPAAIGVQFQPGRVQILNITLEELVGRAHGPIPPQVRDRLIVGWPKNGIKDKRFDITATLINSKGRISQADQGRIILNVLTNRFSLRAHRESRTVDGYHMALARPGTLGPGLRRVDFNCAEIAPAEAPKDNDGRSLCGYGSRTNDGENFRRLSGDVAALVFDLNRFANRGNERRVIVDATGLKGFFVWEFSYGGRYDPRGLVAAQEQLGLRLIPTPVTVNVVVIDDVRMPTPN